MGRPKKEDQDSTTSRKVNYDGLLFLLEINGMTKTDLVTYAGVSPNVVVSISRGEQISMFAAVKICELFHCDFVNIMSMIHSPEHDADAMYDMLLRIRKKSGYEESVSITRYDTTTAFISPGYNTEGPKTVITYNLLPNYSDVENINNVRRSIDNIKAVFAFIDSQDPRHRS